MEDKNFSEQMNPESRLNQEGGFSQSPNQMDKKPVYIVIAVVAVMVVATFLFIRSHVGPPSKPSPSSQTSTNAPTNNVPAILKAVMSRSIDAKGNATGIATTFNAKTDKIIYAVLALENATKNTKLSYVRYLNGKYVDSKVALASKDGIANFYFAFEKGIGDYPKGIYTLNLYVNGRHTQTLTYVFK